LKYWSRRAAPAPRIPFIVQESTMEKTTIAAAPSLDLSRDALAGPAPAAGDEPRSLADWELVLVGGGETTPNW